MPFEYIHDDYDDGFQPLIYNKLEKKNSICQEKDTEMVKMSVGTSPRNQGCTQDFLKGVPSRNCHAYILARGLRKMTILVRKLFTMLQVSSVLPHSKNFRTRSAKLQIT